MYKADAMNRAKSTLAAVTGGLRVQRECVCVCGGGGGGGCWKTGSGMIQTLVKTCYRAQFDEQTPF